MTIKKLKEMINDLPDDMRIYADDSSYSMFGDDASEFVCIATSPMYPKMAIMQSRSDIDCEEELSCMADMAIDGFWGDDEYYSEALERGFKIEDFQDPDHARKQMEYYGLIK